MGTSPDPDTPVLYIRYLPKGLKARLIARAAGHGAHGVSLNAYVIGTLEEHLDALDRKDAEREARVRKGE